MKEVGYILLTWLGFLALIWGVGFGLNTMSCYNRFSGSSLESRYTILGGCQVRDPNLGWIPSSNFRVI